MLAITAATALGAAVTTPTTPPTFATDFYVGSQESLNINQGGYKIADGACCSLANSPQCKVQAVNDGSDHREQAEKEQLRDDGAQGAIATIWGSVKKQMALVPGAQANSTHKWACAQYCPQDGDFVSELMIGDGQKGAKDQPKMVGSATITQPKAIGGASKMCDDWRWTETIFGVLPMQVTNFWVTQDAKPQPFFSHSVIEPFGQTLGEENASYISYTPNPPDLDDYFDIDPDSIAKCPMSDNCQQDAKSFEAVLAQYQPGLVKFMPRKSLYDAAKEAARTMDPPPSPPSRPNITFAKDFIAEEDSLLVTAQGNSVINGDPCCSSDSPAPQCQIQTQHLKGTRYYDSTNQRSRFDDALANQIQVDDYKVHKSMLINVSSTGALQCQEYCPIDPQDTLDPFDPFDPFDSVLDLGKATYMGKPAQHYQWKDKIFKVITMETTDFYANITDPKAAIPLFSTQALTPFGQLPPIGTSNETWTTFTAGAPPADKFKITGVATCPQSGNCGQQSKQLYRLKMKQLHTFAKYHDLARKFA